MTISSTVSLRHARYIKHLASCLDCSPTIVSSPVMGLERCSRGRPRSPPRRPAPFARAAGQGGVRAGGTPRREGAKGAHLPPKRPYSQALLDHADSSVVPIGLPKLARRRARRASRAREGKNSGISF